MKYLPLVWAGLWRRRTRTIFTLLSITIAFLLFGMLQGVNHAFGSAAQQANIDRLYVVSRVSMIEPLPISYMTRIESVPGVADVAYGVWFGGYHEEPRNFIFSYPVNAARYFSIYSELLLPKDQLDAMIKTRNGAVIGTALAARLGWKIGDTVPVPTGIWTKADGTSDWTFRIVGIYKDAKDTSQANSMYFNYEFFDEMRNMSRGTVSWFIVRVDDPARAAQVGEAIDRMFANSSDETQTQTEKEYAQAYFKQFGDINLIVTTIVGAVFFTLLFLTGNTMMQSVRERIPELAVLKTLGFTDTGVVALLVAESAVLCIAAAALGLAFAVVLFPYIKDISQTTTLPAEVVVQGLAVAVVLALATALPPAFQAGRLRIVDALARR
jgi:putative ABC transport system permease protein